MRDYSGPHSFAIPSCADWYRLAMKRALTGRNSTGLAAKNSYYLPHERRALGYLCMKAYAEHFGWSYDIAEDDWSVDRSQCGDIPGAAVEIKFMGWRKAEHMDACEGGHLYVPDWTTAPVVIGMTAFDSTLEKRVFVDGWIRTRDALAFPKGGQARKGPGGKLDRAHLVPYWALSTG